MTLLQTATFMPDEEKIVTPRIRPKSHSHLKIYEHDHCAHVAEFYIRQVYNRDDKFMYAVYIHYCILADVTSIEGIRGDLT